MWLHDNLIFLEVNISPFFLVIIPWELLFSLRLQRNRLVKSGTRVDLMWPSQMLSLFNFLLLTNSLADFLSLWLFWLFDLGLLFIDRIFHLISLSNSETSLCVLSDLPSLGPEFLGYCLFPHRKYLYVFKFNTIYLSIN